jgi:hypothetical protein
MATNKDFHEAIVNMRNNLHKQLGLMLQVEAQTKKAEIRINQERMEVNIKVTSCEFQTQLKEVKARVKGGRGTGTSTCTAKPTTFDGTTSWAVFWHQFKTVTEHNMLDMPREIHILDHCLAGLGH